MLCETCTEPEGKEEEEEKEDEEQQSGARRARGRRAPRGAPTLKEKEEHNLTHLPYRSWCPACVAGRGRGPLHRKRKEEAEEERPLTVCLDFWYPGKGFRPWGEEEQEGEEEEEEEDSAEGNAAAAGGSSSSTDPGDADGERPLHKLPALVLWEESTQALAATLLPSKSPKDFTYAVD